jgi:hypothetical protein
MRIPASARRRDTHGPAHLELRVDSEILHAGGCDISSDGVGVLCRRKFTAGQVVALRRDPDEPWVPMRVAHCTQTVGGYRSGLRMLAPVAARDGQS